MRILNTLIPYNDETLLSFFIRLSHRNGFALFDDFYEMCVSPYHISLFSGYNKTFSGDPTGIKDSVDYISGMLPEGHQLHDDPTTFYREHSLYPLYEMFFSDPETECGKIHHNSGWLSDYKHSERPVYFCKKCFDNDIKEGKIPYIHRIHQIDGVCVCAIHKTPLYFQEGFTEDMNFDHMIINENYNYVDPSIAYQYAVMCKELLENPVKTTGTVIEKTISNTMRQLPDFLWASYVSMEYDYFKKNCVDYERKLNLYCAAEDTGLIDGNTGYVNKRFSKSMEPTRWNYIYEYSKTDINTGLVMLFILFRTADYAREIIILREGERS